jgi:hypothetical protein
MVSSSIPGDIRGAIYEAVNIEKGNPSELVNPKISGTLKKRH